MRACAWIKAKLFSPTVNQNILVRLKIRIDMVTGVDEGGHEHGYGYQHYDVFIDIV